MMKRIFTTTLAAMLIASLAMDAQKVGEAAPDFTYSDLDGKEFKLSKHAGKVVFIFAFGNNCPYCKEAGPKTESQVQDVYGKRSDFIAIGLDTWDNTSSASTVGAFKSATGISYRLFPKAGSFEQLYATSYDRVIVVDQQGIIRHKNNARVNDDLGNAISVIEGLYSTTSVQDPSGFSEGISSVFPNPAGQQLSVTLNLEKSGEAELKLYSLTGQEIRSISPGLLAAGEHTRELDVSGLPSGMYILKMETSNGSYASKIQVAR